MLLTLIIGGVFFSVSSRDALNAELQAQDESITLLTEEIELLKLQVETLIADAQDETKEEINTKIIALEKRLTEERELRENLETQFESQSGISSARLTELEEDFSSTPTFSAVINEWRKRTANVRCSFSTGTSAGSGILMRFNEDGQSVYGVLTNQHVMTDALGRPAQSCSVTFPDTGAQITGTLANGDLEFSTNGFDFGRIVINNPSQQIIQNATGQSHFCSEGNVSLGDSLVIIGYPAIGAGNDVTATEGIISGFEDDYYITSAKVEQGNSGGAAVLLEDSCLLGIPTFVQFGSLESLARILKIDVLYK